MMTPTELDLDAIEALANYATPGPWTNDCYGRIVSPTIHVVRGQGGCKIYADAEFIATARDAVPALVAEVRRLRAALDARPIYTMDISHKDMVLGEDGVYYFAAPFASDYIEGHQVKAVKLTGKAQASIDPDELPDEAGHA